MNQALTSVVVCIHPRSRDLLNYQFSYIPSKTFHSLCSFHPLGWLHYPRASDKSFLVLEIKSFLQKLKSCREGPVKVQKQGGDESTLGYPATEHGEKERQGRLHYISCMTHFCNGCSVVFFVFLFHHVQ